jgi:hypothetical protein
VNDRDRLVVPSDGNAESEFVRGQAVSGNFFSVLGVPAMLGRTFTEADDQPGKAQPVVVISHGFWERRFAADPSVIGRTVNFKDVPVTIIGVTPPGFFGFQPGDNPDLWWPLQLIPQVDRGTGAASRLGPGHYYLRLMGRLAPGAKRTQAEAEFQIIFQRWLEERVAASPVKWTSEQRRSHFAQKLELQPGTLDTLTSASNFASRS